MIQCVFKETNKIKKIKNFLLKLDCGGLSSTIDYVRGGATKLLGGYIPIST